MCLAKSATSTGRIVKKGKGDGGVGGLGWLKSRNEERNAGRWVVLT